MLDDSQSNTVVITTVGVLKSAFFEWADELAQSRKEAENDVMIDEAVVIKRLRKSRATLWRWNANGYLPCYKLGGKNQYFVNTAWQNDQILFKQIGQFF